MPTLLLVDDEQEATEALQMVLELRGFTVRRAASGAEAVAAVRHAVPDLVLLDLQLPDMTGWDVLRQLRQHAPAIKAVIVTGSSVDRDLERQALETGALGLLLKPMPVEEMIEAVQRFLLTPRDGRS